MTFDNYLYTNPAYAPRPFTYIEPEAIAELELEDHASIALEIFLAKNAYASADKEVHFAVITDLDENVKHVGVRLINDNIVDIEGVMEPDEWEQKWVERLAPEGNPDHLHSRLSYELGDIARLANNADPEKAFGENQFFLEDFTEDIIGEVL